MVSKKRLDGLSHIIWLCLVCFFIDYLCKSDHEIDIPYVKRKFEWEDVGAFNVWWSKVSCAPPQRDIGLDAAMILTDWV